MKFWRRFTLLVSKQYAAIGGQAVIEGVMMRSPNAFVVAVRTPDGSIRLRRDQWFGLNKKFAFLRKPFLRGVLMLVETMANGIVSLNYSANVSMDAELKAKAIKKGKTEEQYEAEKKKSEKVDLATFLTMAVSLGFGIGLFVFVPHALTAYLGDLLGQDWGLNSFAFHTVDGIIKASIFILYIWIIGFMPDVRRVFQYHGAEHKSISTFEAELPLTVENARKFTTQHPRCGTSFLFFLILVSIILFSVVFTVIPVGVGLHPILRHAMAAAFKVILMLPVAGVSYELIKAAGKCSTAWWARAMSAPGMLLQKLTTREPEDAQLEVALASIKAVLYLEEKYDLKAADKRVLSVEEIDLRALTEIEDTNSHLKDFLE
ncbi:MAG: DUF1385 domain-containing protein [Bacteriovoracaceae bacterium]|nr:DUF1385 domain-containing protein [Bacteriovoracaceae bacterium]